MKKIICDICKKNETHNEYFFETHTSFNGVDRDKEGGSYDLCDSCYLKIVLDYLKGISKGDYHSLTERNKKLIQLIKERTTCK